MRDKVIELIKRLDCVNSLPEDIRLLASEIQQDLEKQDYKNQNSDNEQRRAFWTKRQCVEEKRDNSGYIYFIRETETGAIKIGKTGELQHRVNRLDIQLPYETKLLGWLEVDNRHRVEYNLHSNFEEERLNGEWFDVSSEDIREFCREKGLTFESP